jgi:hypothetical protein
LSQRLRRAPRPAVCLAAVHVQPQRRHVTLDEQCPDGQCEAEERVILNANPGLFIDMSDGAMMSCYHCHGAVCMACKQVPVRDYGRVCAACE